MKLAALALATSSALAIPARATTVSPVVVDLQSAGRGVVANVSVNNTGASPLPMEVLIQPLKAGPEGFSPAGPDDENLIVVPPSTIIPAGQTQTFRVQWAGDPALAESRHYYVGFNQLPVKLPEGQSAVQIVYNFQVLVNIASPAGKPALSIQSVSIGDHEGKPAPVLHVQNDGDAYGYLSQHRIAISEKDAGGKEIFSRTMSGAEFQQLVGYGLVAAHQKRTLTIPVELPSKSGQVTATMLEERQR
ncbi:fimbria/pilus periplasmic chaperone [Sphingobium sp.]|uniref:fimbria/pilus periplasmic chaperone n=1 Tax=Sphingobium sp. TaxID=1912891 RepID=UPI0028BDB157|nr:fimbria/pilus periplasmic chaperone [Sphingobium sp.]